MIDTKYFDDEILESEAPYFCPFCKDKGVDMPTSKGNYSVECSDLECEYFQSYIEEKAPEKPDAYDWVLNK